jgi:uncharacterized protein YheU (UPF0270 family)
MSEIEYSILIETFTLQEGGDAARCFRTLEAAVQMVPEARVVQRRAASRLKSSVYVFGNARRG